MTDRRRTSYTGARTDLVALLPALGATALPVLDVGCSNGATGRCLMSQRGVDVIGIELDPILAGEATVDLERVEIGDATEVMQQLASEGVQVSAVLFGDVLEHLVDPWTCVDVAQELMPAGGWIITSIPNVAHVDTIVSLLRGTWPMRDRGIHDDSHLRFFARKDLPGLLDRGRASMVECNRVYRIIEHRHPLNLFANLVGRLWPNLFTFQFRVVVEVRPIAT